MLSLETRKVKILGAEWTVQYRDKSEDPLLELYDGYTDNSTRTITVRNGLDENSEIKDFDSFRRSITRHEVIHAFLYESGLDTDSHSPIGAWAVNEEMVDWIAIQLPKIADVCLQLEILA